MYKSFSTILSVKDQKQSKYRALAKLTMVHPHNGMLWNAMSSQKRMGSYFYVHKVKQDSVHIVDDATLV